MNVGFMDGDAARKKESDFEMERRVGVLVFAFIFFFACGAFIESTVARVVVDGVAAILYWMWTGRFEAPSNYKGEDDVSRYHRAVIRMEKLITFNGTLILMIFVLVGLWKVGRCVDGPEMCNPNCHWCKERIAEEIQPDESYNPQGRE